MIKKILNFAAGWIELIFNLVAIVSAIQGDYDEAIFFMIGAIYWKLDAANKS